MEKQREIGVGRSFRNANQVTVLGRPIRIVVIAER